MTSLFIVAASDVVRAGLESLTLNDARFTVVGTATNLGELASQIAEGLLPDAVIIVAEGQPEDVLRTLHASFDELTDGRIFPRVLVIGSGQSDWARDALRSGIVWSVLPTSASIDEIISAVEAVSNGLIALDTETFSSLLSSQNPVADYSASIHDDPSTSVTEIDVLTPREREVLGMLSAGLSNKEIAWRMKISEHTVKFHIASIFTKLDVSTRTEAVMKGIRKGLVLL